MKYFLYIFLPSLLALSCSNDDHPNRKILIAEWFAQQPTRIKFDNNSAIFSDYGLEYGNKWSITDNELFLKPTEELVILVNGKEDTISKPLTFDYKISGDQDTLYIKRKFQNTYLPLSRIENGLELIQHRKRLQIQLPEGNDLGKVPENFVSIDIYAGFRGNNLLIKSEDPNYEDLTHFNFYIFKRLSELPKDKRDSPVNFNLIADHKISEEEISIIKDSLRNIANYKIFRVYQNEKLNYDNTELDKSISWYGRFE